MPIFNYDVIGNINTGFYNSKCPFHGNTCRGRDCICAITEQDEYGNEYFSSCEMISAFLSIDSTHGYYLERIENRLISIDATASYYLPSIRSHVSDIDVITTVKLPSIDTHVNNIDTTTSNYLPSIDAHLDSIDTTTSTYLPLVYTHTESMDMTRLPEIYQIVNDTSALVEEIKKVDLHVHNLHRHPISHMGSWLERYVMAYPFTYNYGIGTGHFYTGPKVPMVGPKFVSCFPPAVYLIQEWTTGTDTDENNLVYGRDFMIDNKDPNKPMMLKGIEKTPYWKSPETKIHYHEYVTNYGLWPGEEIELEPDEGDD